MGRPAGPWVRIEAFYIGEEKEWSNIFWYKANAGGVNNVTYDFNTAGLDFAVWWDTHYAPLVHPTVTLKGINFLSNDGTTTVGVDVYLQTHNGTAGGDIIPEEVAAVVSLLAPTGGRHGRGRIYVSGLATTMIDGSYMSTIAGGAALQDLADAMKTSMTMATVGFDHQVYSPSTSALHAITRAFAIDLLGTNRKRRTRF